MSPATLPRPRRPRPVLKRRTAVLILTLGLMVLATGVLLLIAALWATRELRRWGFDASPVLTPGIGLSVVGIGVLAWWWMGRRRR
jgi:uncharacterized membrane protein HdeD (DUF308 family)